MARSFLGKISTTIHATSSQDPDQSYDSSISPNTLGEDVTTEERRLMSTKSISVDNVLRDSSEIPSGVSRDPISRSRKKSRYARGLSLLSLSVTPQNVPGRSTKVTEKLVLIPETTEASDDADDSDTSFGRINKDEESRPLTDAERNALKKHGKANGMSYAERLPKEKRADELARVTAYCTAQSYKTRATAKFLKETHGARTKQYDDCLYTVYHLPLLPGAEGFRIKSSPMLKNPGGKALLDEEIERSEQRDYHDDYFGEPDSYGVRGSIIGIKKEEENERARRSSETLNVTEEIKSSSNIRRENINRDRLKRISPDAKNFAEMFVFSYGVVVFWNFTERQEKDILADLTFSDHEKSTSLVLRPLEQDHYEKEEFHFEYSPLSDRPRVFNDMITLRSGDHMIKLSMSHAIAQSTKLSFFEEQMNQSMSNAKHIPKHLALTGQLGMTRGQILKMLGNIFKSRVDVNLSSNILDVPKFFWDSEPTLHPLYFAFREYLEIERRTKALNERCKVFLELAEILSESISNSKMSTITWIIIFLIVVSICVTVMEVGLRSILVQRSKHHKDGEILKYVRMRNWTSDQFTPQQLQSICGAGVIGKTFDEKHLASSFYSEPF